ncbi:SUKH-4 family immunity protein [Streptomyces fructofermentans]|uniref:SUKH-4 family immunity protein n=1 Tax=Streptomyces fructofermentans TaxID=152141 RepID=UPI00378DDD9D
MVTFAQAQERAEEWINGDVPGYQHREVRVREFDLGFVVWAEDRADGPRSDGGAQRLVIARDSGDATLWPALPVGEVIRRYEERYGLADVVADATPAPPARVDLNQTSFLLTPPEWLQEAADRMGIPDRRERASDGAGSRPAAAASASVGDAVPSGAAPLPETMAGPVAPSAAGVPAAPDGGTPWPAAGGSSGGPGVPADATPWAGTDTNAEVGEDRSVPLPTTVYAPQIREVEEPAPPAPEAAPEAETRLISGGSSLPSTAVAPALDGPDASRFPQAPGVPGGPRGAGAPGTPPPGQPSYGQPQGAGAGTPPPGVPGGSSYGHPQGAPPPPAAPAGPGRPPASHAGDIADAATSKAQAPPRGARGAGVAATPPPPGAPGTPGARPAGAPSASGPGVPGTPAGGYVPTQMVSQIGPDGPVAPGVPGGTPPGGGHHAATVLAGPSVGGPGAAQPPGPPGVPGPPGAPGVPGGTPSGGGHHAATVLAGPSVGGPGAPQPPGLPGAPGVPGAPGAAGPVHHAETMLAGPSVGGPGTAHPQGPGTPPPAPQPFPGHSAPGQQPPAYGYPQPGLPTVGPGYQAVLRYRAHDGSEQQLIRRSAPGTPHPEWQILHELRAMNVPPQQVLELHTELESCELPGAYCARMIRESWPQARITSIAPYGTDHASRQQGMAQLLAHQGELHQVADGPARPGPVRAPLPPVQPVPPIPPEAIGQELAAAFGPGLFRFDHVAVSRQGVPPIVAHTLVAAGLPVDMNPFFWAQAQPGRPVPTLAELAQERGVQPAADAGSYLVMGSDFGKAICVQYGTANIVAVPVEAGPGGAPVPPQFVNTGLPEFARSLALLGRMWRLRFGLNQEQAGRWTVDFQAQLASLDPAALASPESWWSVLLEQMWDGLL